MNKQLTPKIVFIIVLILLAAVTVYPPSQKLKGGPDLAGGVSLIYQIDTYGLEESEKRDLSQEELAFECGLHRTYIGAVERGEYNVTLLTLRRITDTLGIRLADAVKAATKGAPRRR